jgi:hypothetical protein
VAYVASTGSGMTLAGSTSMLEKREQLVTLIREKRVSDKRKEQVVNK